MNKKRGFLIVVVLLALLSVFSLSDSTVFNDVKDTIGDSVSDAAVYGYAWLKNGGTDSFSDGKVRFSDKVFTNDFCESYGIISQPDFMWDEDGGVNFARDCGNKFCCPIQMVDYVQQAQDDCTGTYLPGGFVIKGFEGGTPASDSFFPVNWFKVDKGFRKSSLTAETGTDSFICDTNFWKQCNSKTKNSLLSVDIYNSETKQNEPNIFICTEKSAGAYEWLKAEESTDTDSDGVPDALDCQPQDSRIFGKAGCYNKIVKYKDPNGVEQPKNCNVDKDCEGLTVDGATVNGFCDTNKVCEYESCLLGNDAKEICGDGIDNNCDGKIDNCGESKEICTAENNLDWNEQGMCCGDETDDLGKLTPDHKSLCVKNNDQEAVGGAITDCGHDWCWIDADLNGFTPLTIKPLAQQPYDVVSNGEVWSECKNTPKALEQTNILENKEKANQFYCYQEGNHWSWAQCYLGYGEDVNKNTIKDRAGGDALYSLLLDSTAPNWYFTISADKSSKYAEYYNNEYFDFSNYDNLEFFFRYPDDIKYPAAINVTFLSADNEKIYSVNTLGNLVSSSNLESKKWLQARVKITGLRLVSQVQILSSPSDNLIEVRNVFLTKENEPTLFCSGLGSPENNNWISFDSNTPISGEEMCNEIYDPEGKKAWLGGTFGCCGNLPGEYYAGESEYGCWNSQAVADGEKLMNVEVKGTSKEVGLTEDTSFQVKKEVEILLQDFSFSSTIILSEALKYDDITKDGLTSTVTLGYNKDKVDPQNYNLNNMFDWKNIPLKDITSFYLTINGDTHFDVVRIDSSNKPVPLSKVNDKYTLTDLKSNQYEIRFLPDNNYFLVHEKFSAVLKDSPFEKTFSCINSNECTFSLPGQGPYTVTNPHPGLYDLYFVVDENKDGKEEEIFIDGTGTYDPQGKPVNIRAKKVAKSIIYSYEPKEDGTVEAKFYGCEAPSSILIPAGAYAENLNYCDYNSKKSKQFCSYSYADPETKDTIINTWSDEALEKIGYEIPEDISHLEIGKEIFQLRDFNPDMDPTERNTSALVLPGRNFISNPFFEFKGGKLVGWEFVGDKLTIDKDKSEITLTDDTLISEKIALPQIESKIHFKQAGTCQATIFMVDKEGKTVNSPAPVTEVTYPLDGAVFLTIKFTGSGCTVKDPILQLLDEYAPAKFDEDDQQRSGEILEKAGAACCPRSYCWNGFACVGDMQEYTFLSENVDESRNYRCTQGKWTELPVKKDWNGEKAGFCNAKEQCFVTQDGSKKADTSVSLATLPYCLDDGSFILDHYCAQGNWSSRTKLLAQEMLKVLQENDEYVLYCTDPVEALNDLGLSSEYYLGISKTEEATGIFSPEKPYNYNCFEELDSLTSESLIKPEENTCVNNFCVLKVKNGDSYDVAFATTLNRDKQDDRSFFYNLGFSAEEIAQGCQDGENFVECNLNLEGKMFYSGKLKAVAYGQNLEFQPGFLQKVWDMIKNIFVSNSVLSEQSDYINEPKNFRDLYLLNENGKEITAVKEVLNERKKTLVAEYKRFKTPICDYVNQEHFPKHIQDELLPLSYGQSSFNCFVDGEIQRVEASEALDYLWPQLTGKIRVAEE